MDWIFKSKKRIFLGLLILNFAVILLCYANYVFATHYSADSFSVMLNLKGAADNSLRNGRITSAILYFLMDKTGLSITEHQMLSQLMCVASLALFATVLSFDFFKLFDGQECGYGILGILDLGFLFLVMNPNSMSINFFYVENSALYAVSNLLLLFPVHVWCCKELNYKRVIAVFFLLVVALDRYQVFIELYVGICLCYSWLKSRLRSGRLFLKEYFVLIVCSGTACAVNLLQMRIIQSAFGFESVSRAAVFDAGRIMENIKTVLKNQWNIWSTTFGLLPRGYLLFLVVMISIGIIYAIKQHGKKETGTDIVSAAGVLLVIWIMAFSPLYLTGQMWLTPRTYWGMYTVVLFLLCVLADKISGLHAMQTVSIGILAGFLFVMMIRLGEIQVNTIISNHIERCEMEDLIALIHDYEQETQNHIESVCYQYDSNVMYAYYDRVKFIAFENNCRISVNEWGFESMLRYYLGRKIEIYKMEDAEYHRYFGDGQWDRFDPDEQVCFDDNRVYIAIY